MFFRIHGETYFETLPTKLPAVDDDGLFCTCSETLKGIVWNNKDCDKIGSVFNDYEYEQENDDPGAKGAEGKEKRFAHNDWYSDDIIDHVERSYFVDDPQVQHAMNRIRRKRSPKTVMSKDEAMKHCRQHIEESEAGRSCKHVSGANIGIAMEQCIADLEVNL